jgi:hypothetical protein
MKTPTRRLDEIILVLSVMSERGFTQRELGAVMVLINQLDQQLGQLLMPPLRVGAYFDVFETALMKLSTDNEPDQHDVRRVLADLRRFQAKMLSLGGSMVLARQREASSIRPKHR